MQANRPVARRLSAARKELLRGDSWFAVLIFIVVTVFLLSLVASVWNNVTFQRGVREKAAVQHLKAVGTVLSKAAEALMTADELSMLRRVLVEGNRNHRQAQERDRVEDVAGVEREHAGEQDRRETFDGGVVTLYDVVEPSALDRDAILDLAAQLDWS